MPTYVYGLKEGSGAQGCAHCRDGFETVQKMSAAALEKCPECGTPVERRIQSPMLGNIGGKLKGPSNKDLGRAGFTKYERKGKGYYERTAGNQGPSKLGE